MQQKKVKATIVDSIQETDLPAWRRSQWFENAKLIIQIILMAIISLALVIFLTLMLAAGVLPSCSINSGLCLPDTAGVKALSTLFIDVVGNAKAIALFALGFFFKEYLNATGIGKK